MITFALGIPHASWKPERKKSLFELALCLADEGRGQFLSEGHGSLGGSDARIFADREPNYAWSGKLWKWASETDATHLLQLQDDALVCPEFWAQLHAMVSAVPDKVIGLESAHPVAKDLPDTWYTTPDMLIGVGYVVPTTLLQEFLVWRSTELRPGGLESVNEDQLLGLWCFVTGRKIWHPVPTIIDHDTSLPSTYGNDEHQDRRPTVTWKDRPLPGTWRPGVVVHAPRFYRDTPRLARRWVKGATEEDYQRWITT